MLSIERTKQILADATLSDKEAESIRDSFRDLAEIIINKMTQQYEKNSTDQRQGG